MRLVVSGRTRVGLSLSAMGVLVKKTPRRCIYVRVEMAIRAIINYYSNIGETGNKSNPDRIACCSIFCLVVPEISDSNS